MARILEQAGETVPLLIMIDAPEPLANVCKEDDVEFLMDRVPHYHGVSLDDLDLHHSREDRFAQMGKPVEAWKLLALGGMAVHDATGNHFNLVSPVNTPALVKKMKECVDLPFSE